MIYRRNADVDLRELEREASQGDPVAQAALKRARARAMITGPELPGFGCYELRPLEGHPGFVEIYLDGRRAANTAFEEGSEGIENFINYSIGERANQGWWYEASGILHYPSARCWECHFPAPRYLHPRPRRVPRRPRSYRDNPDEGLRRHERAAAAGDPESLAAAARERRRAGEDVLSWELSPIGQVFHQAFLMGKEGRGSVPPRELCGGGCGIADPGGARSAEQRGRKRRRAGACWCSGNRQLPLRIHGRHDPARVYRVTRGRWDKAEEEAWRRAREAYKHARKRMLALFKQKRHWLRPISKSKKTPLKNYCVEASGLMLAYALLKGYEAYVASMWIDHGGDGYYHDIVVFEVDGVKVWADPTGESGLTDFQDPEWREIDWVPDRIALLKADSLMTTDMKTGLRRMGST